MYGGHGMEYQLVQILLNKSGKPYLCLRKITADRNVPYGKVTRFLNEGLFR